MDPVEKLLTGLVEHLMVAWQLEENRAHPLGELAAEAAAVLQFYQEHKARSAPQVRDRAMEPVQMEPVHWSHEWRRTYE